MSNEFIKIGNQVIKLGSLHNHSTHRLGIIIDINNDTNRARVNWTANRYNEKLKGNGIRTWVRFSDLAPLIPREDIKVTFNKFLFSQLANISKNIATLRDMSLLYHEELTTIRDIIQDIHSKMVVGQKTNNG